MTDNFIPQMKPDFGAEERLAVNDYMSSDGYITEYKLTECFENQIAEFTGAKHCIVVNNGTVSLTLAALALGIKAGDEIIVPNYTMIATPNSIRILGATPVFVDVEEDTLCMSLEAATSAITRKTRAILLVSPNGRFPKVEICEFQKLARGKGISLIEDAAQSLGSYYPSGLHIGRAGEIGSFSFSTPKIISTGQGGALITDSDSIAKKIRKLKDFGRSTGGNDVHDEIGFNFKFTDLQAAVGIAQMEKLRSRIERKKQIWESYASHLKEIEQIKMFNHDLAYTAPWFIDCIAERRNELAKYLRNVGVGSRPMYPPINQQAAYNLAGSYPVSENIGAKGLWLPSFVQITDSEIYYVCQKIKDFYKST